MASRYLLGPDLLDRTRRAVAAVESDIQGAGFRPAPIILEEGPPESPKTFRVATFTGAWAIGATKAVSLKYVTPATQVTALNLFAAVPAPSGSGDCAIAREGTAWFLIAARCS